MSLVLVSVLCLGSNYKRVVNQTNAPQKITKQIAREQTLFFYRPDCPDCQKVLPTLKNYSLFHRDIVFINMNLKDNKSYIEKYELTQVPTFIKGNTRYEGTSLKKIKKLMEESS